MREPGGAGEQGKVGMVGGGGGARGGGLLDAVLNASGQIQLPY